MPIFSLYYKYYRFIIFKTNRFYLKIKLSTMKKITKYYLFCKFKLEFDFKVLSTKRSITINGGPFQQYCQCPLDIIIIVHKCVRTGSLSILPRNYTAFIRIGICKCHRVVKESVIP